MASRHLDDPLEYLYEELPPQELADARSHLAECVQCREETAAIRAIVQAWRGMPRPPVPAALRGAALEAVRAAAAPAAPPQPVPPLDEPPLQAPIRRGWLLHPGWLVAALVIFAGVLLIHLSPRRDALRHVIDSEPAPTALPPTPKPAHESITVRLPSAAALAPKPAPELVEPPIVPELQADTRVVIVLPDAQTEPPQVVARPAGGPDPDKLVFDLGVLAGMQLGAGELQDAAITISRLEKLHPQHAASLRAILQSQLEAATVPEPAQTSVPEPDAEPEPELIVPAPAPQVAEPMVVSEPLPPEKYDIVPPAPAQEILLLDVVEPAPEPVQQGVYTAPDSQSAPLRRLFTTDPYYRGD